LLVFSEVWIGGRNKAAGGYLGSIGHVFSAKSGDKRVIVLLIKF